MTGNTGLLGSKAYAGNSLIELALILPVLLLLVLGVIDFARAIQFNNILVSMSREGANLAARTTLVDDPQYIIGALTSTAEPMDMATHGMVYITRIVGRKLDPACNDNPPGTCPAAAKVDAQFRTKTGGDRSLQSKVWACTNWLADGSCRLPAAPPTVNIAMSLRDGEMVYAVETLYDYTVIVNFVMQTAPELYSQTIL